MTLQNMWLGVSSLLSTTVMEAEKVPTGSMHHFPRRHSNWGFRNFSLSTDLIESLGYSGHESITEIGMVNFTVYLRIPRVQNISLL